MHIKHAKEELIRQIKELKTKEGLMEQILQSLTLDDKLTDTVDRLKQGDSYESIVDWLGRNPKEAEGETSPRISLTSAYERESDHEMAGTSVTPFTWTSVISDGAVLDHLFQLYFTWVHPVHTLFSESHFIDSRMQQSERFCSSVLVNAICAMACHLHSVSEADEIDYEQLGIDFADAVRTQIDPDDRNITTTQALGVMFLLDCARGKGLRGSCYLEMAKSSLTNLTEVEAEGFLTVLKETARGIRSLSMFVPPLSFNPPSNALSGSCLTLGKQGMGSDDFSGSGHPRLRTFADPR